MNVGVRVKPRPPTPALEQDVGRIREILESGLARFGGPWLAGADSPPPMPFFAPVAFRICTYGLDVGAGQKWVNHILADPALRQWESAALAETWREASHEADLARAGEITADYRMK